MWETSKSLTSGSEAGVYFNFVAWDFVAWDWPKGLQRQRLIGSAVAGFNHAKSITKAFATDLHTRKDDSNKGIWSPGSLVNNQVW